MPANLALDMFHDFQRVHAVWNGVHLHTDGFELFQILLGVPGEKIIGKLWLCEIEERDGGERVPG